jgi:glutamate dehydrogenase/leucine dehydrogenase
MEYRGATQRAAFEYIDERIRANTRAILEQSRKQKQLPRLAAMALAKERVEAATKLRRWHR